MHACTQLTIKTAAITIETKYMSSGFKAIKLTLPYEYTTG